VCVPENGIKPPHVAQESRWVSSSIKTGSPGTREPMPAISAGCDDGLQLIVDPPTVSCASCASSRTGQRSFVFQGLHERLNDRWLGRRRHSLNTHTGYTGRCLRIVDAAAATPVRPFGARAAVRLVSPGRVKSSAIRAGSSLGASKLVPGRSGDHRGVVRAGVRVSGVHRP